MTEQEWLASIDPAKMLEELMNCRNWLGGRETWPNRPFDYHVSDRKLRLFACACCRLNGATRVEELENDPPYGPESEWAVRWATERTWAVSQETKADLLRHIVGNPFRPLGQRKCPKCGGTGDGNWASEVETLKCAGCYGRGYTIAPPPAWPAAAVQIAEAVYDGQDVAFALHDALLEMGQEELAEHFRQPNLCPVSYQHQPHDYCDGSASSTRSLLPGHPKGCWALDYILGKE
jgi:hypothetical protein